MTDPVSNMLANIKNAYRGQHQSLEVPYSRFKEEILKILVKEGFLNKVEVLKKDKAKTLKVSLLYQGKKPALAGVKVISKPSLRIYVKSGKAPRVLGGTGVNIISTSQGLMTGQTAEKKGLGGEFICQVW